MADLSRWIYAEDFTGQEAAYLILGVDPSIATLDDGRRVLLIEERLKKAYEAAFKNIYDDIIMGPMFGPYLCYQIENPPTARQEVLYSVEITNGLKPETEHQYSSEFFRIWLESGDRKFRDQRFSKVELGRWITENKLVSHYEFSSDQIAQQPKKTDSFSMDKPLSNRERDTLLTIIAVLCKEAKFDYTKHAKTAGLIQSTAVGMGLQIGESTIEEKLKKITNALASRMK